MDAQKFQQLVSRLEAQSAASPGRYRLKVAGLTLLGFGILALMLSVMGAGLLALVALAAALAFSGGGALLLLFKLGKLLLLLAVPMWYFVKSGVQALFVRLPAPQGREIARADAPQLFAALDHMRVKMRGPRFHHVLVVDDVNAGVVQRPAWGLVGWPRNYLLLGLPLLEGMAPEEALAVVAHEYGHLAGSHSRFSSFIYRLRHTWATVQAHTDQVQGWLGKTVAPLVRWYAPYFNAYTFVMARAHEYQADAASVQLVGSAHAAHALKRVNLMAPQHQRFMDQTLEGIPHQATPPGDLLQRWAAEAQRPLANEDAQRWLQQAMDRPGHYADSHPTLRARLQALQVQQAASGTRSGAARLASDPNLPPPPLQGPSAAQVWLGPLANILRAELQHQWAQRVAQPWAERHREVRTQSERLKALRAQTTRDSAETLELLRLTRELEPETDQREALAAFNAEHPDHANGLYLEGCARLKAGDASGIEMLERVARLDPDATKLLCERAYEFYKAQGQDERAEPYAQRWRARDELETLRNHQLAHKTGKDSFSPHGMSEALIAELKAQLGPRALQHVSAVYIARRDIPADPSTVQWILGVRLTLWGRQRHKQQAVINRLAELDWPVPLLLVSLDHSYQPWLKKMRALNGSRLV